MLRRPSVGLLGRILVILLVVMATEFAANTFLLERASHFALEDDDARRMAEHLVVARRVLDRTAQPERGAVAREISTEGFDIGWAPGTTASPVSFELERLRSQMLTFQPDLLAMRLRLHLQPVRAGGTITGTMVLSDGSLVAFRTSRPQLVWPLTFSRLVQLFAPMLALVVVGVLMIRATFKPLSTLMRATKHVGTDGHEVVPERGPQEVRALIRDFNAMHARIDRLIKTRTQALVAVAHDLRTPLARLRLRLDHAGVDEEARQSMTDDIAELSGLLQSLQDYVSGDSNAARPERVDLAAMAQTIIDNARDQGRMASYYGPDSLELLARPVTLRRALGNLVDNALHYGGNVRLILREKDAEAVIRVEDDGPGIPEEQMGDVLQPFVRIGEARARNTDGMGLGLAIVNDAVQAEGGTLKLENQEGGGLRVTVRLPLRLG